MGYVYFIVIKNDLTPFSLYLGKIQIVYLGLQEPSKSSLSTLHTLVLSQLPLLTFPITPRPGVWLFPAEPCVILLRLSSLRKPLPRVPPSPPHFLCKEKSHLSFRTQLKHSLLGCLPQSSSEKCPLSTLLHTLQVRLSWYSSQSILLIIMYGFRQEWST